MAKTVGGAQQGRESPLDRSPGIADLKEATSPALATCGPAD
ncbi:MAG: hypothetical protein U0P82_09945 [Vicinamibacterales bacterium]